MGPPLTDLDREVRTNVFVGKLVSESHTLRLMLDRFAVNDGVLELLNDRFVDRIALCSR